MDQIRSILEAIIEALRTSNPLWLIMAVAFLPLAGIPASPLLVLVGVRFGPVWGSVAALGALTVNITSGYWLAVRWLHPWTRRWTERRGLRFLDRRVLGETQLILLCRVTPGVPLALQNYILGCARVRFGRYLMLSIPVVSLYAFAFVVFGDSLNHSSVWRFIAAASLLVAAMLIVSVFRRRLGSRLRSKPEK